jgi:hypothetical protein
MNDGTPASPPPSEGMSLSLSFFVDEEMGIVVDDMRIHSDFAPERTE